MNASLNGRLSAPNILLPTALIGIGLSGFFDGILLHQVLQWHHLLSLVPGPRFQDLGTQILADGLFHVLMYLITACGLWLLWRRRASIPTGGAMNVIAGGLLGFGLWNVIDVGLFHWILGIHRIRVNVPDPMTYDVIWIFLLGFIPLLLAWGLLRRADGSDGGNGVVAATTLSMLVLVASFAAALPQRDANTLIAFFPPAGSAATVLNAAIEAGTPIVWMDQNYKIMAVRADVGAAERLYKSGALFVTRSPALAGCAAAVRT